MHTCSVVCTESSGNGSLSQHLSLFKYIDDITQYMATSQRISYTMTLIKT